MDIFPLPFTTPLQEQIIQLCFENNVETILSQIKQFYINFTQEFLQISKYMLNIFAGNGNLNCVRFLVEHCLENIHTDPDPIINACFGKQKIIVEYLVDQGFDFRAHHDSPLLYACESNAQDIVKYLIDLGADPFAEDNSPIIIAGSKNYPELFSFFLTLGADPYARNNITIYLACIKNQPQILQLFLDHGLRIDVEYEQSGIAACASGHTHILTMLLDNGATVQNSFFLAALLRDQVEVIRLLFERGAEPATVPFLEKLLHFGEHINLYSTSQCVQYLREKINALTTIEIPLDIALEKDCPICLEENNANLIFPCRHVICENCFKKITDIHCPVCRLPFDRRMMKRKM